MGGHQEYSILERNVRLKSQMKADLFNIRVSLHFWHKVDQGVRVMHHNKSRQHGRFAPGPLNSGPCLKRYVASFRGRA